MVKITIPGRLHGLNDYIRAERTTKYKGAQMKRLDQAAIEFELGKARKLKPPVWIAYRFFEPTMRRDKDNVASWAHKVAQDALVARKLIPTDGWSGVENWINLFSVDSKWPRIEITVYSAEEWQGLTKYAIYRTERGTLDCVPETSRLYPEAAKHPVMMIEGTAFEAWGRLEYLERMEHPEAKGRKKK